MQLLFLSNNYPPYSLGGYEQWCREVAVSLAHRGHSVHVLTSNVGARQAVEQMEDVTVHRRLHLELTGGLGETMWRLLVSRSKLEAANLRAVQELVASVQPDAALVWGMWNVPRSVPALVEKLLPDRVAYYLCDYWLTLPTAYIQRWQEPARSRHGPVRWAKQRAGEYFLAQLEAEKAVSLQLVHPICVSQVVRQLLLEAGVPVGQAPVIYGGTQVEQFTAIPRSPGNGNGQKLKLLYAGRLEANKGVHTALEAIKLVVQQHSAPIALDIYGRGDPDYETGLKRYVAQNDLQDIVLFHGSVPRHQIPQVFAQADVLLFTSEWAEPFARTVLEAMAAGLVVVGTSTGGTAEILQNKETGLTYAVGDWAALAAQITRMAQDPLWRQQLAAAGRARVLEAYTFNRMVDELEAVLTDVAESTPVNKSEQSEETSAFKKWSHAAGDGNF
jgi:glycogen synthase